MSTFPYALYLDKNFKKLNLLNTVGLAQILEEEIPRTHTKELTQDAHAWGIDIWQVSASLISVVKSSAEKTDHVFVKETNIEFYIMPSVKINSRLI